MPASRSVVSVLLRELGDFSLHSQGRPAGGRLRRPSSAGSTSTGSRASLTRNRTVAALTLKPALVKSNSKTSDLANDLQQCKPAH